MNVVFTSEFKNTNGTPELTVSIDQGIAGIGDPVPCGAYPAEQNKRTSRFASDPSCSCAVFFAVFVLFAIAVGIWMWHTLHVQTLSLQGGRIEIAALSFDRWPVATAIVGLFASVTASLWLFYRHVLRMTKLASDERKTVLDMRRFIIEKAFDCAKPIKSDDRKNYTVSITVNKQYGRGKGDGDSADDAKSNPSPLPPPSPSSQTSDSESAMGQATSVPLDNSLTHAADSPLSCQI